MAKRKRLNATALLGGDSMTPEGGAHAQGERVDGSRLRAPIATVSGEAAAQSAFEEVAEELQRARVEGRMVLRLPLEAVVTDHLVRDRVAIDTLEMDVLKDSLRARGQQAPIDVVALKDGRYGLISGWRRLTALRALLEETQDTSSFGAVLALVRAPNGSADAYRAMIEENEIRADLSFYERARIAVKSVEQGIFPDAKNAVQSLFSAARAPKRSKIVAFTSLVEAFDDAFRFPAAIPEKLGLALVQALQNREGFERSLRAALRKAASEDATQERQILDRILKGQARRTTPAKPVQQVAPGVMLQAGSKAVRLTGSGVDDQLIEDLTHWLAARPSK